MQVGVAGPTAWVRVAGRGTFQNSTGLKEFAAEMMHGGHRKFIVDLRDCELMDSTFMGTLAGIALRLGSGGELRVINANERCQQVMKNLGLDHIVIMDNGPEATEPAPPMRDAEGHPPRQAKREAIIEAHENLVAAAPENEVRFKDVIDFLQSKKPAD